MWAAGGGRGGRAVTTARALITVFDDREMIAGDAMPVEEGYIQAVCVDVEGQRSQFVEGVDHRRMIQFAAGDLARTARDHINGAGVRHGPRAGLAICPLPFDAPVAGRFLETVVERSGFTVVPIDGKGTLEAM